MTSKMKAEGWLLFFGYLFAFVFALLLCITLLRQFGVPWFWTGCLSPFAAAFCIGVGVALTAPRKPGNDGNEC